MKTYFVTGIGTGVGKTIASAVLVEALKADYWKPVQAGDLENTDTDKVRSLVSNPHSRFHPEQYRLVAAMSPHAAADLEGITITIPGFSRPATSNNLVIEGAGGLMVPLNGSGDLMIDLIQPFGAETILVSQNYLGSINHTLLSVAALRQRNIPVKGILFNGEENEATERIIARLSGLSCLGRIPWSDSPDCSFVMQQAGLLRNFL